MATAALILSMLSIFITLSVAASTVIGQRSIPKIEIVLKDEREDECS